MKKIVLLLSVICLLVLGGCSSGVKVDSSYDNAKAYAKYLKTAKGDPDLIEAYYEETDGGYYINTYNGSEYFYQGKITFMDEAGDKIGEYTTKLIYPQGDYYGMDVYETLPDTYINSADKFYTFSYPNVDFEYDYIYYTEVDWSEDWYNILLEDNCTLENIKIIVKYEYALDVITDIYYDSYYFYDNTMEEYYHNDYEDYFPDEKTAIFKAEMDYEGKTISIYKINETEPVEVIKMD